jgi:hypothetical protein
VFQRDGLGKASIYVSGTTTGGDTVEARWGTSGAWTTLGLTGNNFYGLIVDQTTGQKTLYARKKAWSDTVRSVAYVGVGDIFVIYGQSNASGRGTNNQAYTGFLKASSFKNNYLWGELTDPTDISTGQVDVVSNDGTGAKGSIWPIIADSISRTYNVPVAIIPCAMGGKRISELVPGTNHNDRTTMYGSMKVRSDSCGDIKAVLIWEGETDAQYNLSQTAFNTSFDNLANAVNADLGCKIMPCLMQSCSAIPDTSEAKIRSAISEAVGDNTNVLDGPDFSDISDDADCHILTNAKIDSCANRFWRKIRDNIY